MSVRTLRWKSSNGRRLFPAALLPVLLGVLLPPLHGAVYVLPADGALVDRSPAIVYGEVAAVGPGPMVDGAPTTVVAFQVEEVLKGFVPGRSLSVRQEGGAFPDGSVGMIAGLPMLGQGDRALLFLYRDGPAWRTVDLGVGLFLEARAGDRTVLARGPAPALRPARTSGRLGRQRAGTRAARARAAREPVRAPVTGRTDDRPAHRQASRLRDGASFRRWIADRAAGLEAPAGYFVPEADVAGPGDAANGAADGRLAGNAGAAGETVDGAADGRLARSGGASTASVPCARLRETRGVRWREFDGGGSVSFDVRATQGSSLPGLRFAVLDDVRQALGAWNADTGSSVDLRMGSLGATVRPNLNDGRNTIVFDDPGGRIEGGAGGRGGVLARTWLRVRCEESAVHAIPGSGSGGEALPLLEADIVLNNGVAGYLSSFYGRSWRAGKARSDLRELVAHELGHALGLGDSCGAGNCDRALVEDALETGESLAALRPQAAEAALMRYRPHLHGRGASLAPHDLRAVRGLYPEEKPGCTHGPAVRLRDGHEVSMCWWRADGVGGTVAGEMLDGASALFWFFERGNPEVLVKVLDGCGLNGHRWVFASGATDLGYEFKVAVPDGRVGTYENWPGRYSLPTRDLKAFDCQGG